MSFPLNAPQREAVRYVDGPLLVLAGAGSGKTRVITAKIAHLLELGHAPTTIAAITFTNKAAREMRDRVGALLADAGRRDAAKALRVSTFHSLGVPIVRGDASALGLKPGFSILDPDDIEPIVAAADRHHRPGCGRARRSAKIRQWKNALVAPATAAKAASSDDEAVAASAYARYDDTLRAYQAVDFDDLIALPIALLERDRGCADALARALRHLLVDEYQDTNARTVPSAAAAGGRARALHRGRRRRPGDLRLARRDGREPRAAAGRLSRR